MLGKRIGEEINLHRVTFPGTYTSHFLPVGISVAMFNSYWMFCFWFHSLTLFNPFYLPGVPNTDNEFHSLIKSHVRVSVFLFLSFLFSAFIEWHLQDAVEPSWQCQQSQNLPYPSSTEGNIQVISVSYCIFCR